MRSEMGPEVTTIDGNQMGSVVSFKSGEGLDSIILGFTVANGRAAHGGGILCIDSSSPTITGNIIRDNWVSGNGGGISCRNLSSPIISNNTVTSNKAIDNGAGIHTIASTPTIIANQITWNTTDHTGGGIRCVNSALSIRENIICMNKAVALGGGISCEDIATMEIANNSICNNNSISGGGIHSLNVIALDILGNIVANNDAGRECGGVFCEGASTLEIMNCTLVGNTASTHCGIGCYGPNTISTVTNTILWNDGSSEMCLINNSSLTISYSDIKGGQSSIGVGPGCTLAWGLGMIESDPLFVDPSNTYKAPDGKRK